MLFYFSNVERQRTFSFSEFFCYDFFHHKNGGRTQFWARPVKFDNTTVNFFSFFAILAISRVDTYNTNIFRLILSRFFSVFRHRSRSCQAIQFWLNQDSPPTATLILFDCNLVALKRSIKLCKYQIWNDWVSSFYTNIKNMKEHYIDHTCSL